MRLKLIEACECCSDTQVSTHESMPVFATATCAWTQPVSYLHLCCVPKQGVEFTGGDAGMVLGEPGSGVSGEGGGFHFFILVRVGRFHFGSSRFLWVLQKPSNRSL